MNWNKNPPPPGVNPQYSSYYYNTGRYESGSERPINQEHTHKPGRPGGGWDEDEEVMIRPSQNSRSDTFSRPAAVSRPPAEAPSFDPERETRNYDRKPAVLTSEQAGLYENVLVEDITAPGGVRPRPPDKDMHEFLNKCKYLSPEIVVPLLIDALNNPQRAFKALCVIEKLVHEYEAFAEIASEFTGRIRNAGGNQASAKVVTGILSRYNAVPQQSSPTNIIDLF